MVNTCRTAILTMIRAAGGELLSHRINILDGQIKLMTESYRHRVQVVSVLQVDGARNFSHSDHERYHRGAGSCRAISNAIAVVAVVVPTVV